MTADARTEMSDRMNKFISGFKAINKMREKMIAHKLRRATATCPWCGEKDALRLSCAIGYNNHLHGRCGACGEGFME